MERLDTVPKIKTSGSVNRMVTPFVRLRENLIKAFSYQPLTRNNVGVIYKIFPMDSTVMIINTCINSRKIPRKIMGANLKHSMDLLWGLTYSSDINKVDMPKQNYTTPSCMSFKWSHNLVSNKATKHGLWELSRSQKFLLKFSLFTSPVFQIIKQVAWFIGGK